MEVKFICEVDVDAPVEQVSAMWSDPNNLGHWQEGFLGIEHLSGNPGSAGARSRMLYLMRGKEMELLETIIINDLPREFVGEYEHVHMSNRMTTRFSENSDGSTHYWSEIHYTQLNGFMIKFFARLFPGLFKKQVMKWIMNFKRFVDGSDEGIQSQRG